MSLIPAPIDADLLIVGGGLNGLSLALAAAQGGLGVAVVEARPAAALHDAGFDGRVSAIAFSSVRMLRALGVIDALEGRVQPILDIRVSDGKLGRPPSPFFLHFDHRAVGDEPFGLMVENRHMRQALHRRVAETPAIRLIAPATLDTLERAAAGVFARTTTGEAIRARLVAACDGGLSLLRQAAGIGIVDWSYGQTGIVTTVTHERPHLGVAHEHFLPSGPFAILPMTGNRSSLVWTERSDLAPALLALDDAGFDAEIGRRFGTHLGKVEAVGPRFSYPLAFRLARRFVDRRLALVGDAAHTIHPIAGQGFNLGLRDVAALADVLAQARRLGIDPGDDGVLDRYQAWRRPDVLLLGGVMDGLTRLFSNDLAPVRLARDLGLAAVERMPALKRFFMNHARGAVGTLPRLLRGEAL